MYKHIPLDGKVDTAMLYATLLGALGAMFSVIYLAISVKESVKQNRQDAAFSFIKRYEDLKLSKIYLQIKKLKDKKGIMVKVNKDKSCNKYKVVIPVKYLKRFYIRSGLLKFLGFMEDAALAIKVNFVDEEAFYRSIGYAMADNFDALDAFIESEQKNKHDELYKEQARIIKAWKNGSYFLSKKKLPYKLFTDEKSIR